MLFNFLYDACLALGFLFLAPKLVYQRLFFQKYKGTILQRFGLRFPKIEKKACLLFWIHAVSVGETKAISALAKKMRKSFPKATIVLSSVTETGRQQAEKSLPEVNYYVYLPFDFRWIVKPIIKKVKPDLLILSETDFWFNLISCCKEENAYVFLVNGQLSEKSFEKYRKTPWLTKKLFSLIDHFCVQDISYKKRFLRLGIQEDKITVTGNTKIDIPCGISSYKDKKNSWKEKLGVPLNSKVLVAGSTHHGEEEMIVEVFALLQKEIPDLFLLIVPRHPERFEEVATLLERKNIRFKRFSKLENEASDSKVILIDSMGILNKLYEFADIALVAGSYTQKVGGHNILEPLFFGTPVVFGPHMHKQKELSMKVQEWGAGIQVSEQDLLHQLLSLLQSEDKRKRMGQAGLELVHSLLGATEKTYCAINIGKILVEKDKIKYC